MDIPLVSPRKLDQYVARYPGVWIVDVRSGEEYRRSHIRYAVNIPYEPGKEWNLPGEKEIVVYCERGATSMAAVREEELQNIKEEILCFPNNHSRIKHNVNVTVRVLNSYYVNFKM